jgi:hypothetical protein
MKGGADSSSALGGAFGFLCCGIEVAFVVVVIVGMWNVFSKAGEPGWASIVPIYNVMVLARIGGKPEWWGLLMYIPLVGLIFSILICLGVAENFRRSSAFGLGLAFLGFIFFPILGFGSAKFRPGRRRRFEEEDEYEERPRRRRRRDDDEDDDEPRVRRRRDEDDEEEDRPSQRRRREPDDRVRRPRDEFEEDRPRRRRPRDED